MVSNRFLGSIGNAIDSAASGTFLAKRASGPVFETLDYADISNYPTGGDVDSAAMINLIDSNFLSTRTPGVDITTTITDSGLNHIVPDSAGESVKIGNYSKGIANVFADSSTTIKISSHTISLSTDHILFDGGTAASDYSASSGGSAATYFGDRGIYAGAGNTGTNYIEYITITSAGNGTDFGDLTSNGANLGSVSNGSRIVFSGFQNTNIEYITSASPGNATDFGDLTSSARHTAGCSNGTRGLFMNDGSSCTIDYITIATTGNAQDFGDMSQHNNAADGSASGMDATYGLWAGGRLSGSSTTNISYVSTATLGNSADFGDITVGRGYLLTQIADTTRSVFAGGFASNVSNVMDYVTTATPGNATDFGDMSGSFARTGGTNNSTIGVIMGGWNGTFGGGYQNQIQKFTIQTAANTTDFGDMTASRHEVGACSGNAA